MIHWLKSLAGGLCIMTVLLQLIPDGKLSKYVRFYARLLFFLMAAHPAIRFLTEDGELERLLQLEFVKDERYDMETALMGMEDMKNDQIILAYRKEVERQIYEITKAYQAEPQDVSVQFDSDSIYQLASIAMTVIPSETTDINAIREEIAGIYMLTQTDIIINVQEAE